MNHKYYLGIDLHKKFAYWHLITTEGEVVWHGKVATSKVATQNQLKKCAVPPKDIVAAIESVDLYGWYADVLTSLGVGEVKLANPWKLRLIAENPLKNDKEDARIIAKYLKSGTLPESYLAPQQTRDLRELVRTRMFFVRMRTSAKIRIRSVLSKNGLTASASEITSKKAQDWFSGIELPAVYRQEYVRLREHIIQLNEHVMVYDAEIKKQGREYPEVDILKSIPGIADIRSMMIVAEVGTFLRFRHPDKLASFAGLVPRSYSSGGKERLGRITKHGSSVLRHALVGAAQQANASWGDLFTFYERIKTKHSSGAAKVALARKLLTLAWHLTRKNEPFKARFTVEPIGSVNV